MPLFVFWVEKYFLHHHGTCESLFGISEYKPLTGTFDVIRFDSDALLFVKYIPFWHLALSTIAYPVFVTIQIKFYMPTCRKKHPTLPSLSFLRFPIPSPRSPTPISVFPSSCRIPHPFRTVAIPFSVHILSHFSSLLKGNSGTKLKSLYSWTRRRIPLQVGCMIRLYRAERTSARGARWGEVVGGRVANRIRIYSGAVQFKNPRARCWWLLPRLKRDIGFSSARLG